MQAKEPTAPKSPPLLEDAGAENPVAVAVAVDSILGAAVRQVWGMAPAPASAVLLWEDWQRVKRSGFWSWYTEELAAQSEMVEEAWLSGTLDGSLARERINMLRVLGRVGAVIDERFADEQKRVDADAKMSQWRQRSAAPFERK